MGCISSKSIARSLSIREELNHGFQSTSVTWEELLTSHRVSSGNDQLFALVCSAKLKTSSFTLPSTDPQTPPQTKYLANAWNLIPEINGDTELKSGSDSVGEHDFCRFIRSKSCQIPRHKEALDETDGPNQNKLDWKDKNLTGSRSFHTVEEYDALLERIHNLTTSRVQLFQDVELLQPNCTDEDSQNCTFIQRITKDSAKETGIKLDSEGSCSLRNCDILDGIREQGWKRKAVAKGLKSLEVSSIEFPAIARVRQWSQVCSPGTYITPKFGSYNAKAVPPAESEEKSPVFSPELVAALEDCMQQLQEDEDSILRQMDGYEYDDEMVENQVQQAAPSNMKELIL